MISATTIIVGGGQAGLAMSRALSLRGVDHLILERKAVATAWRSERWESLRLLTPNWANLLPGDPEPCQDPDGFMSAAAFAARLERYAGHIAAPVKSETEVRRAWRTEDGYRLETSQGPMRCRTLVMATGAFARPKAPALAAAAPSDLLQMTTFSYKRPSDLPDGGVLVVGASASGVQLAREIQLSGRPVTLAVGNHIRVPRQYRGRDIEWWLHAIGVMDERFDAIEDLERARRAPSPQLVGAADPVDLNALQKLGVDIVGRIGAIRDGEALFSGGLANLCASADLKMLRLLDQIDAWAADNGVDAVRRPARRPAQAQAPAAPRLRLSLVDGGVRSILWATGGAPDFSWVDAPVFDPRGRLRHRGGVVDAPGLYVLGLPLLRRRRSHQICGVGDDAEDLATHLKAHLDDRPQAAA